MQVDTFWLEAQDGDVVLLCSDGLTDMVAEEEFAKLLAADKSCEQIARDLVRAALAQRRRGQRHHGAVPDRSRARRRTPRSRERC